MRIPRRTNIPTTLIEWAPYRPNNLQDRARAVAYLTLWKDNAIAKMKWNYPDFYFREYEWDDEPNLDKDTKPSFIAIKVLFGEKE